MFSPLVLKAPQCLRKEKPRKETRQSNKKETSLPLLSYPPRLPSKRIYSQLSINVL